MITESLTVCFFRCDGGDGAWSWIIRRVFVGYERVYRTRVAIKKLLLAPDSQVRIDCYPF